MVVAEGIRTSDEHTKGRGALLSSLALYLELLSFKKSALGSRDSDTVKHFAMAFHRLTATGRRIRFTHYSSRSFTSSIEPDSPLRRAAYVTLFALTASFGAVYYFDSRAAIHRYLITPVIRHVLDPESSHKLAVSVLASGWGPRDMLTDDERLKTEVKCVYTSYSNAIDPFILSSGVKHCQTPSVSPQGLTKTDGQSMVRMRHSTPCEYFFEA
jgi:hypothetical protein